jgi:hypothetical protein
MNPAVRRRWHCLPCANGLRQDRYRDVSTVEVPDFIWLAHNSEHLTPVLIKIESPSKKWFTDRGDPHDDLLRAINHLREWKDWLTQPRAITAFHANFDTPFHFGGAANLDPTSF